MVAAETFAPDTIGGSKMRLLANFNGSRGDVQPGIALAVELVRRGHTVTMAVPPNAVDLVRRAGLDARACGSDTAALLASDLVSRDLSSPNPARRIRAVSELTLRDGRSVHRRLEELATGADAVIGSSVGQERGINVAEKLGVPYVPVHYCPVRSNRRYSFLDPPAPFGSPPFVRLGWSVLDRVLWTTSRRSENVLRDELGLPPAKHSVAERARRSETTELQAYDRTLFPGLADEWGLRRPLVGFLEPDPSTRQRLDEFDDRDLRSWLDDGPPPIYVGFGSMRRPTVARAARILTAAALDAGHRVLAVGADLGPEVPESDPRVHRTTSVNHAVVLPRCRAVVHHGGAGSTAAGLRAGRATLVCHVGADQSLWGRRVLATGVGASVPARSLNPARAAAALGAVTDSACVDAADALSERLTPASVAVTAAADHVESVAESTASIRRRQRSTTR